MSVFLSDLVPRGRILIVGDVMVDRYVTGEVTRISPEAPVPVLLTGEETMRPGGAANVAANVVAMGGRCELLAIVGEDSGRRDLEDLLRARNVEVDLVVDPGSRTTEKMRVVSGTQQIVRVDREGATGPDAQDELFRRFERALDRSNLVVFSDYAKGTLERFQDLLAAARARGQTTLVDPKQPDPGVYRGVDILKPNATEFRQLFGACREHEMVECARAALARYEIGTLIVTRGARGVLLVDAQGLVVERPTEALEVYDVSGAGDAVLAALAVGLSGGIDPARALHLANVAAGIAVSHAGTYVVSAREIDMRLAQAIGGVGELLALPTLQLLLDGHRGRGARIVFTNGCFDILHPGHVRMLRAARELGDVLVVGLNDDESVRRLKGPGRPVNRLEDRAEVLAGLQAVDHVVAFSDDTPLALIRAVRPDVLVKGGDYVAADIVGADDVVAAGGQVVVVDYHDGHSTTRIVDGLGRRDAGTAAVVPQAARSPGDPARPQR